MSLFSSIKDKVTKKLIGELVTDLGALPIDSYGTQMSIAIRQRPNCPPHLQVKIFAKDEANHFQIVCTREWADQFERLSQAIRKHIDPPVV